MSRTVSCAVAAVLAIGVLATYAFSYAPPRPQGVLAVLQAGQPVAVKDIGGRYELSVMPGPEVLGHQVIDVAPDYIVVRETSGLAELRIPIYSIKAVITVQGATN
jgi:hypothetical protein